MGINPSFIQGYANSITDIINGVLVPALISIAFITFLWGIYKYFIKGASNEAEKGEGRMFAMYGIIGFVILFSVWGIVQIFMGTLGLGVGRSPTPPTIGGGSGSSAGSQSSSTFGKTCVANGGSIDSNGQCVAP